MGKAQETNKATQEETSGWNLFIRLVDWLDILSCKSGVSQGSSAVLETKEPNSK